jgi:2-hydroxychromene-2-carboxylate isomerase
MSPPLEFWFEFASNYSYPAAMRIERLARGAGRRVIWRPFLLGPIFRDQGWTDAPANLFPAKGRYMWRDTERVCAALGLPFRKPSQFPRNGLNAARIATAFADEEWLPQFVKRVYTAEFGDDLDIASAEVLRACLSGVAPDPDAALAAMRDEGVKAQLRRSTERAVELGIFGAPTFVVGNELFWGNDRLETALSWDAALRS